MGRVKCGIFVAQWCTSTITLISAIVSSKNTDRYLFHLQTQDIQTEKYKF